MAAPIRKATAEDASALSKLGARTFIDKFGDLYKREDLDAFLNAYHSAAYYDALLADPDSQCWVIDGDDGALIAYCSAGPCGLPAPDMPESSGELCRIYVDAPAQGMGLGGGLLNTALSWLEARFEHLYVGVFSGNDGAQKLYRRYGFEKVAEYHFMVGNHADLEWIMKKTAKKA